MIVNKENIELMEQIAPGMGDLDKWTREGLSQYGLEDDSPVHKLVGRATTQILINALQTPGMLGHIIEGALGVMYVLGRASVLNKH